MWFILSPYITSWDSKRDKERVMQNRQEPRGQERWVSRNPGSSRLVQWSAVNRMGLLATVSTGKTEPLFSAWAWIRSPKLCVLSRPILCDPMDCGPPGSSVHGIPQGRRLEWVAVPSSRGSSWPRVKPVSLMSPALAGGVFTTSATWGRLPWCLVNYTLPGLPPGTLTC